MRSSRPRTLMRHMQRADNSVHVPLFFAPSIRRKHPLITRTIHCLACPHYFAWFPYYSVISARCSTRKNEKLTTARHCDQWFVSFCMHHSSRSYFYHHTCLLPAASWTSFMILVLSNPRECSNEYNFQCWYPWWKNSDVMKWKEATQKIARKRHIEDEFLPELLAGWQKCLVWSGVSLGSLILAS